jgi:periplasmic protein TonB
MTPRMFQDLVMSSAVRPSRGRGRALPLSLAVHGAVFAAIAAVPLLREPDLVEAAVPTQSAVLFAPPRVAVVVPPAPPQVPRVAPRTTAPSAPREPGAATTSGPRAALPTDLSTFGSGDPEIDTTPLCLHDCAPGGNADGLIVGDGIGDGSGEPGVDPTIPRRAGVDVTPPLRIGGAQPVYPELGKAVRTGARVVIECTIDPSGRVVNAVVTRGHPLFDAAALDAVRTWTYRPTLIGGVPVAVLMTVTVNFTLR